MIHISTQLEAELSKTGNYSKLCVTETFMLPFNLYTWQSCISWFCLGSRWI